MRGRDKLMEPVEGSPLLSRQVTVAAQTGLPVTVALPPRPHPRYSIVRGAEVLEVPDAADGMGASLATGIGHLREADAVLLLLGDLPEITAADLVAVLNAEAPPGAIVRGATEDGRPGHPLLIPRSAFADFEALKGDEGGQRALARHAVLLLPLPGGRARLDLDTPEDWAAWRAGKK